MVLVRQDTDIAKSNFRLPWPLEQGAEQLRPSDEVASNRRSALTSTFNLYFIARFKSVTVKVITNSTAMIMWSDSPVIYYLYLSLHYANVFVTH